MKGRAKTSGPQHKRRPRLPQGPPGAIGQVPPMTPAPAPMATPAAPAMARGLGTPRTQKMRRRNSLANAISSGGAG